MNSWGGGSGASSASASPASASPLLLRCPQWASDVTPLPSALESHIKVAKGPLPIGVQVEGAEKGVNGVIVAGVSRNGALGKDGRVKVGDYVTRLNNENLRCVTKAQSRSILKRGNCVGASLGLSYIPSAAADEYRESLRRSPAPTDPALQPCDRLSPKIFPKFYRSPQFGGRQEKEEGDGTSLGTSVESEWPPSVSVQLYQPQGTVAATPSDISWAAEEFSSRLASELVPGAVSEVSAASSPAGPQPDLPREPSPPAPPFDLPQPQVAPEELDEESFPPPPPLPSTEPPLEDDELSSHSQPPLPASEDATASIAPITAASPPPSPQTSPAQTSSLLTQSSLGETPLEPPLAQAETSPSLPASTEPTAALPTLKTPSPPPDEAAEPREASSELPEPSTSSDLPVAASSEPPEGSTEPPPSSACQTSQATSSQAPEREKVEVRTSASLSMTSTTSDSITSSPNLSRGRSKYWGEPREVALVREPAKSLGISIVGGRVEVSSRGGLPGTGTTVSGIFIKSVLPNSPAGRSRHLVMGDRILSVNGTDLREATHDQAVDVIRNAANPVNFSVQSLHSFPPSNEPGASGGNSAASSTPGTPSMPRGSTKTDRPPLTPPRSPSPDGHEAQGEHNEDSTPPATQATVEEAAAEETASTPVTQEPSPAPPSAPSAQPSVDSWSEEASSRYGDIGGELVRVSLDRRPVPGKEELEGLGLSLAGNKDRSKTSVFVVGVAPNSPAARSENITQGDELLEINGVLLYGRSHLNASGLIRGVAEAAVELVMRRRGAEALREMAVKPQGSPLPTKPTAKHPSPTRPQPTTANQPAVATSESPVREMGKESSNPDVSPESSTADSAEPREVLVTRGPAGFGITLTEGTTTDLLKGIFVTNISPNSSTGGCAGELKVGDQVVAVNGQAVSEASSSQVAALMQKSPSNRVRLTVATHTIVPLPDDRRDPAHPDVRKEAVKKDSLKSRKSRDSTTPTTTASDMKKELTPPAIAEAAETDKAKETEPAQTTQVKVTASTPEAEAEAPEAKTEPAPAPPVVESDPSSVEILPGQETLMEIEKGGKGLGLSIVGGSDTVLGSVVIHEVYPDGAAAKDGRLAPGDQVLEVNGESLREISHDAAIALLRQTPAKVRLLVYRDLNLQLSLLDPSQIYNIFTIDLMKKPGRGLGLSIVGRKGEAGVFVSEVVKGGVAEADGRLLQGDQILAVNGQNLTSATQETAAAILKTCLGKVVLKIGRWKLSEGAKPGVPLFPAPKTPTLAGADGMPVAASAPVLLKETPAPAPKPAPTPAPKPEPAPTPKIEPVKPPTPPKAEEAKAPEVSSPPPLNNGAVTTPVPASEAAAVPPSVPEKLGEATTSSGAPELMGTLSEENSESLLVLLEKGEGRTLGMGIGKRARGILVTSLQPESVAATKLRVGDRLMAVNGVPVTDQSSAVTAVKASGPKLYLQIARPLAELQNKTGVAKEIALSRGEEGLGFSVVGGTGSTHGDLPILIKSVFSRGAAAKDGRIKRGDQILAVNGESLLGVPHDQAVQLLKEVRGEVVLTILPAPDDLPAAPSSAPTIPSAKSS